MDWQSETSSSTAADETANKDTEQNAENASAEEDAAYGVNMEQVQAVLKNATADKATLTPQMQRMMNRQAENTKRVEETIKGTKSNPRWFVPLFCAFMIIGLICGVIVLPLPVRLLADSGTSARGTWASASPSIADRFPDDDGMALSSDSLRLSIGKIVFLSLGCS